MIGHHWSSSWLALVAMLVLVLMAGILVVGSYTRRATGAGLIAPHGGVSRLFVSQPGLVIEARVAEGSRVKAGDTLFVVSSERQTGEQAQVQLSIVDSIRVREKLIDEQLRNADEAARRDVAAQLQQREGIQRELARLRTQLRSLQLRQRQAEQEAAQYQSLFAQGLVTRDQRSAREAIADDLGTRVSSMEREEFACGGSDGVLRDTAQALCPRESSEQNRPWCAHQCVQVGVHASVRQRTPVLRLRHMGWQSGQRPRAAQSLAVRLTAQAGRCRRSRRRR